MLAVLLACSAAAISPKDVWYPANPGVFCQEWLNHIQDRGHLSPQDLGDTATVLLTMEAIANGSRTATAWGDSREMVVSVVIGGRVTMMVLHNTNPTWYKATPEQIRARTEGLKKLGSLTRLTALMATCLSVWAPALAPQPVNVPQAQPKAAEPAQFALPLTLALLLILLFGGMVRRPRYA